MDWFRWYHGTCSDPKLAGIARRLKLPRPCVIAVWAMVLESASSGEVALRGDLKLDADDIAAAVDMKTADVERVLDQMRGAPNLLTGDTVTSWGKRQFKSDDVTARVRSTRDRAKQPSAVSETLHDRSTIERRNAPETETETETERTPVVPKGTIDEAFDRFWKAYPHRGKANDPRKPAAEKFARAVKVGTDPEVIIRAAQAYADAQRGKDAQFNAQAVTWINQACWEQYAAAPAEQPSLPQLSPDEIRALRIRHFLETGIWHSHHADKPADRGAAEAELERLTARAAA